MVQVGLDFDLSAQLMLHALLLYLGLEEDLERHDEMAFLLPSQVHVSKLPLPRGRPISKSSIVKCRLIKMLGVPLLFSTTFWPGAAVGWTLERLMRTSADGVTGSFRRTRWGRVLRPDGAVCRP